MINLSTDIVTNIGKIHTLYNNFPGYESATKFRYMALGISDTIPTASSLSLGSECDPTNHLGYQRVPITCTFYPDEKKVLIEGIFDEENIANEDSITIREVGIVNTQTLGTGDFFCISQIPPIQKDGDTQIKITLVVAVL